MTAGGPHPAFTGGVQLASSHLAEYLKETGLTADAAREAWEWAEAVSGHPPIYSADTLTPADLARFGELSDLWGRYTDFGWYLAGLGERLPAPEIRRGRGELSEVDQQALRDLHATVDPADARNSRDALWWLAGYEPRRRAAAELDAIAERALEATAAKREAKLAELLTVDGIRHPDPWAWLGPRMRGQLDPYIPARFALEQLARHELERQLAASKVRRHSRAGTGFLRSFFTDTEKVAEETERRRQALAAASANLSPAQIAALELSAEALEGREMYAPDQLDTYELLVSVALATIAHELGLLDGHNWAIRGNRPIAGTPVDRIPIPYPGITEIARALGDRSPERATRTNLSRALDRLYTHDRPIPVPVRVKLPNGQYVDDTEVEWAKWIVLSGTVLTRQAFLKLHPIAVATQARSFVSLEDLLPRYEAARDAIGGDRLRDEWARADLYLRWIAGNMACCDRLGGKLEPATGDGVPAVTVGDLTLTRDVTEGVLWTRTGLARQKRKLGPAVLRDRLEMALAFSREMGSLADWRRDGHKYWLTVPHPDRSRLDPAQTLLLAEVE